MTKAYFKVVLGSPVERQNDAISSNGAHVQDVKVVATLQAGRQAGRQRECQPELDACLLQEK
jgi:hypothetical protein